MVKPSLKLTLDLPKSINFIYGQNRKFNTRYLKREGKEYKSKMIKYIKEQVEIQKWLKLDKEQYSYVDQIVYMNKKGRDADNLSKLINDSITECGTVWEDDTYSLVRTQDIFIDVENPRIEMIISPVEFVGIFDSTEEYIEFKQRCDTCSKFKNNCSKHRKALENRIIPEITKEDEKWICNIWKAKK